MRATVSATVHRYTAAEMRAATGVNGAIGMDLNRRLMPSTESVAARNAVDIAANVMASSAINGIRYCA